MMGPRESCAGWSPYITWINCKQSPFKVMLDRSRSRHTCKDFPSAIVSATNGAIVLGSSWRKMLKLHRPSPVPTLQNLKNSKRSWELHPNWSWVGCYSVLSKSSSPYVVVMFGLRISLTCVEWLVGTILSFVQHC